MGLEQYVRIAVIVGSTLHGGRELHTSSFSSAKLEIQLTDVGSVWKWRQSLRKARRDPEKKQTQVSKRQTDFVKIICLVYHAGKRMVWNIDKREKQRLTKAEGMLQSMMMRWEALRFNQSEMFSGWTEKEYWGRASMKSRVFPRCSKS